MKKESLNSLVTAKQLLDTARSMCSVDDPYIASAGLVILQDCVELILLSCLLEKGVDEQKSIEGFSFDQLVGELRKSGVPVPKSGTIKALNKERGLVKHYGQLAAPETVRRYLDAADVCIDGIMKAVFNRTLQVIYLHELLSKEETRSYLHLAVAKLEAKEYFLALTEIRKALFVEIEADYSIYAFRDVTEEDHSKMGILSLLGRGGDKAAYYKKNKEWIDKNVETPFDFVQLDHQAVRIDLLQWGASTQDFWNLWRLTPQVFRGSREEEWQIKHEPKYFLEGATEENVRYCLDRAISLILKKQAHFDLSRYLPGSSLALDVETLSDPTNVYTKASAKSEVRDTLSPGIKLRASTIVRGLESDDLYLQIFQVMEKPEKMVFGYLRRDDVKVAKEPL